MHNLEAYVGKRVVVKRSERISDEILFIQSMSYIGVVQRLYELEKKDDHVTFAGKVSYYLENSQGTMRRIRRADTIIPIPDSVVQQDDLNRWIGQHIVTPL